MLIIWAGIAGSLFAGFSTDLRSKESLVGRAVTVADALPIQDIQALKGDASDLNNPAYKELKERIQQVRLDNHDLRFVYLMGKHGNQDFIFVDSENVSSPNYSPPGETYTEASVRLKTGFTSNEAFTEGLVHDRWGVWVTAHAPVIDPKTSRVIAMAGVDVNAANYYQQVLTYALVPLLLAAIPLAGLIRDRKIEDKEKEIVGLKNQFVSIASHELRSPLAGMIWAIQSLLNNKNEQLSPHQENLLKDMFRSTEASLATVNEILDSSIFERGQANKLQHEIVDLRAVLDEVRATLKLGAQEKHLTISIEGHWPAQVQTRGDVAALKRSFMNILSNAIKYSLTNKAVEVTYRYTNHEHVIAVHDHGIGIPAKEQPKVLLGYYRATNAVKAQSYGTGLGLWVTRLIIEQHGGRLWLHSRLNHGTTVYVALPAVAKPPNTETKNLT